MEERGNAGDCDLFLVGPQANGVESLPVHALVGIGEEILEIFLFLDLPDEFTPHFLDPVGRLILVFPSEF